MEPVTVVDDEDESQPIPAGYAIRARQGRPAPDGGGAGGAGQGGATGGASIEPCRVHAGHAPARPGGAAGAAGRDPGARAGAHPLRPDAGVAVHLLPRRGADHGRRSGRHAPLGDHHAGLWRRPPDELRRVRVAGTPPGVRHQRLRRDLPGPVGVGRQAAGGQLRHRRARQRVLDQGAHQGAPRPARRVPLGHARVRRHDQPRRVVLPHRRRGQP